MSFWVLLGCILTIAFTFCSPAKPSFLIPKDIYISYKELPSPADLAELAPSLKRMRERESAAGWKIHYMDEIAMTAFVETHYANTSYLWAYKQLSPRLGVCLADMLRLAVLYKLGGVYIDADGYVNTPLDEIVARNSVGGIPSALILPKERNFQEECYKDHHPLSTKSMQAANPALYAELTNVYSDAVVSTWFMIASPGHPILARAMKNIAALIKAEHRAHSALNAASRGAGEHLEMRGRMVLCITGPMLLTRTIYQFQIQHNVSFGMYSPNLTVINADMKIYGGNPKVVNTARGNQQYYLHTLQNPRTLFLRRYNLNISAESNTNTTTASYNNTIYAKIYKERCYGQTPTPTPPSTPALLLPTSQGMSDLKALLRMLQAGTPFAFVAFDYGEIQAIDMNCGDAGKRVDIGWQRCSPSLQAALRSAMINSNNRTYVGIPCSCDQSSQFYLRALQLLNITHTISTTNANVVGAAPVGATRSSFCRDSKPPIIDATHSVVPLERLTVANLWVNYNYWWAQSEMARILNLRVQRTGRPILVFMSNRSDPGELPFPNRFTLLPATDAFDSHYPTMRSPQYLADRGIAAGDVVLLMVGALGRVLTSEWAHLEPGATFLSIGSFYDQFTLGRLDRNVARERACMHKQDVRASFVSTRTD